MNDRMEATVRRRATHRLPNGQTIEIHALGLSDYVAARDRALQQFKRAKIQTWTENVDLLPAAQRETWIREAFERAEALTGDDLPMKRMQMPVRRNDGRIVKDGNGEPVLREREVEYAAWWMSETAEGRLYMTWLSIKRGNPAFTLDDADRLFIDAMDDLETAANLVGDISSPTLGNSEPPAAPEMTPGERRAQRRARRRTGH